MLEETTEAHVVQIIEKERTEKDDVVAREFALTIVLNGQELVTMLCSPTQLKYLALGFLASEGLIRNKEDIKKVLLNERRGAVRVETKGELAIDGEMIFKRAITSGCGKGTAFYSVADTLYQVPVESKIEISAQTLFSLMKEFQHNSGVFKLTGGVHSAALCDKDDILIFSEDIGRHNAVDKILGQCFWEGIPTEDRIVLTSGRISSEILSKMAKRGIPIVVSRSAPTDLAIRTAESLGITLIGFVRGKRMNIYANDWRITN